MSRTWTTHPANGQPWTAADVGALQIGIRKVDSNELMDSETRITNLYLTVTSTTYAYNDGPTGMNELLSTSGVETASFTYTLNGELATKTQAGVTWAYAYNEMGLLREVQKDDVVRATYAYDGLGRRVKTVEDGATTFFVYGLGLDPLWTKTGTTETRHVYANGLRVAKVVGASTYHYHTDALGSTLRMTDTSRAQSVCGTERIIK